MDTKLKNRHKLAIFFIMITILIPSLAMMTGYFSWYQMRTETKTKAFKNAEKSSDFLGHFLESTYLLYNTESGRKYADDVEKSLYDSYNAEMSRYSHFNSYLDYRVLDENGGDIEKSTVSSGKNLTESNLKNYALGMIISYDANGKPSVNIKQSDYAKEQTVTMRKLIGNYFQDSWMSYCEVTIYPDTDEDYKEVSLQTPKNRTYLFAMSTENLKEYINDYKIANPDSYYAPDEMNDTILLWMLVVAAAAWLYPCFKTFQTGNEKIFHAPLEVTVIVALVLIEVLMNQSGALLSRTKGYPDFLDWMVWLGTFTATYWIAASLRRVIPLGIKGYLKQQTMVGRHWEKIKTIGSNGEDTAKSLGKKFKAFVAKVWKSLLEVDLTDKSNKILLRIVICNFAVLFLVSLFWDYRIQALVIYSVILFFILRKYYKDMKRKYARLLEATGELAKGNMNVEIKEDLGMFNPFKPEIEKIQEGYKKAVEEEIKSQRMKTELITNVSHDLKTPLTAIITYVNLLKEEKDEEKKKEYVDVLERKSMRLKVLIEDLFDISKASSKNVTLNLTDVDVVNLFKQVKLELDEKIEKTELEFKCNYPEEKMTAVLDGQKTYRIFENLIVNATKYAMPHTRVFVDIFREENEIVVQMKNVSKDELTFNPQEITERFVRGDESRNSEGSGLGLAIVKKLVDLMEGQVKIQSKPGQGTKVSIFLRFRHAGEKDLEAGRTGIITEQVDLTGLRVLLVEDNELNAEIARKILSGRGLEADWVEDGCDCLAQLDKVPGNYYGLILMDIQMPKMNGYETTRRIRQLSDTQKAQIPIIAMTANAFEEDRKRALDAGMNGFVTKPIQVDALMQAIAEVL